MHLVLELAARLMRCPAAPYHESLVAREIVRICEEHHLPCDFDEYGNILARVQKDSRARPLVFAAHMDHPGFVIREQIKTRKWQAEFLGGVGDPYFKRGVRVLLMPGNVPARILRRLPGDQKKLFELGSNLQPEQPPEYAVWGLRDFIPDRKLLRGRVCDDLVGVAAALAALIELQTHNGPVNALAALTRAEEVGFHGALALARSRVLPRDSLIISLETSREIPPVRMGEGVILRTGDRASIFSSDATRYLAECAADLQKRDKGFKFQQALMSGGTCEATAYQEHSLESAALCVALGNYHNCGEKNLISEEYVSRADAVQMTRLLVESAVRMKDYTELTGRLARRLDKLSAEAVGQLKRQPLQL